MRVVNEMEELRCPYCDVALSEDMIIAKMCFECGESFEEIALDIDDLATIKEKIQKKYYEEKQRKKIEKKEREEKERELEEKEKLFEYEKTERINKIKNATNILVTTCDLKRDYEIISPVYFQISNKGIFSSSYSKLVQHYSNKIKEMENERIISNKKIDFGFLYGEWSVGQNDFERAFYIATEELKIRAARLGADAIIGMRQDIDLDTNGFSFFYLQMYGTAVKFV